MAFSIWWTFCLATFFISATPGPNMLHVMTSSVRNGFRRSVFTMAGCLSAVILIVTLSVAGVGALLKTSPMFFGMLRIAGAAYLIYLGIRSALSPAEPMIDTQAAPETRQPVKAMRLFKAAFYVASSNPKLLLFAAAFFPQFLRPQAPQLPQIALLFATFIAIESGWYMVYAFSGNRIAGYLRQARMQVLFNRVTGIAFIGFGVVMLLLDTH